MKINTNYNRIIFGKTLAAKCDLRRQNHRKVECNILELNLEEDKDYFDKLTTSRNWQEAWYLWDMDEEFNSDVTGERTYVLESNAGRCLGYIVMRTDFDNPEEEELIYLETCPKYQTRREKRPLKYIGETLLSFAIGKLDRNKTKSVKITAYSANGEIFYKENCGFTECNDEARTLFLPRKKFSSLIKKNETHTNSKIRYIV